MLDLSIFDARFTNDETGAPAYDPRILLKIILLAYSRGITSSRAIAECCEKNILFMALSANSRLHFTTIASFIATFGQEKCDSRPFGYKKYWSVNATTILTDTVADDSSN